MNRLKQFVDYANKVFGLREFATGCRDSRVNPQYPCATIIALFVASIAARVGSLYQIERMGKSGELDRFIHTREKPSADTLGRWLAVADYSEFRSYNGSIVQRARRNKVHAYGTICGWRVAAIDGTETFCTQSPTAEALKWSKRTLSNGAIEYYERAAVLSYIGAHPHLILDMERIEPGEGEVTAAIRLLWKTQHRNWRYCDMICPGAVHKRRKRPWQVGHHKAETGQLPPGARHGWARGRSLPRCRACGDNAERRTHHKQPWGDLQRRDMG